MKRFADIDQTSWRRGEAGPLGDVYWAKGGPPSRSRAIVFAEPSLVAAYVSLHEYAHLWIHRDLDLDAWIVVDVDEPMDFGDDYVVTPGRIGNSMASFYSDDAPEHPPQLARLNSVMPALREAAQSEPDRFVAACVCSRLERHDPHVVFVWREARFYLEDLSPSAGELQSWERFMRDGLV